MHSFLEKKIIRARLILLAALAGLFLAHTAEAAFAMDAKQEIHVGSMHIEALVDDADHSGSVNLLRNTTPELLARYVPTKKLALPYTSLLIRDEGRIFLVDSGMGNRLLNNLKERNIAPEEVSVILLTHMHPDHIGGLLQKHKAVFPNAIIYVAEKEHAFWSDSANMKNLSEPLKKIMKPPFDMAQEVLAAYKKQIVTFIPRSTQEEAKEIMPGVEAIAAYGHTPGHTVFLLHSKGKSLLVLGDTFHVGEIQLPHPEVTLMFDVDQAQAAKSRQEIFAYATKYMLPVTATHKPAPHFGMLKAAPSKTESYLFTPL